MRPEITGTDVSLYETQTRGAGPSGSNSGGSREATITVASPSPAIRTPVDVEDTLGTSLAADAEQDEPVEGISEGLRKLSIGTSANRYHGRYSTLVLIGAAMDLRKRALEVQHGQLPPLWPRKGTRRPVSNGSLNNLAHLPDIEAHSGFRLHSTTRCPYLPNSHQTICATL